MNQSRHTARQTDRLCWFAFRVKPQTERKVAQQLRWQGMKAVVPVFRAWRRINRYAKTKTPRERPIMPGYIWVGFVGDVPWWRLLGREDVFSVVSFAGVPACMDRSQVARMLADERRGVYADSDDWRNMRSGFEYKVGETVEFEAQGFEGFTGKVVHLNARDARILFEMFGAEREITVPVEACSRVA